MYCAAVDKHQANIVYDISKSMVELCDELKTGSEVYLKSIYIPATMSTLKSITSTADSKHGFNAHGIIVDEIHVHKDRELYDTLKNSTGTRRQPLDVMITTAGIRKTGNFAWEMHKYAKQVADGTLKDESFLSVIYGVDEAELKDADDIFTPETWAKANPGYPVYPKHDYLEDVAMKAKNQPGYLNSFKRFHLNIWTSSELSYIKQKDWAKCNHYPIDIPENAPVILGIDLASTGDFTSLACVFKNEEKEKIDCFVKSWIPEMNTGKRKNHAQIREWIEAGWVVATPGNVTDYNFIQAEVVAMMDKYDVKEIAHDTWNMTQLSTNLMNEGAPMVEFRQGYKSFSPIVKELWKLVQKKELNHAGNPVLSWMIDNVTTTQDPAGNLKPDKQKSSDKIDGVVALLMALSRAVFGGALEDQAGSIYEDEELTPSDFVL